MLVACARDIKSSRSNNRANLWGPTQAHTLVNPCKSHAKLPPKLSTGYPQTLELSTGRLELSTTLDNLCKTCG